MYQSKGMIDEMTLRFMHMSFAILLTCTACAGAKKDAWSNIDYSGVYKAAAERRDIDSGYKGVVGCVDDDLYNCR